MPKPLKGVFRRFDDLLRRVAHILGRTRSQRRSIHQFLTFAVIGVANTAIDFSIYTALTRGTAFFSYEGPEKYLANVISFSVATTFSYYCNRNWTFGRKGGMNVGETARFYATTASGMIINTSILYIFTSFAGMNDLFVKTCGTVVTLLWNFFMKKFWVFPDDAAYSPAEMSPRDGGRRVFKDSPA